MPNESAIFEVLNLTAEKHRGGVILLVTVHHGKSFRFVMPVGLAQKMAATLIIAADEAESGGAVKWPDWWPS